MEKYKEIAGDMIQLALEGNFDVIVHGCNCFSAMGGGLAPKMASVFGCDDFEMERIGPSINKLGNIDYENVIIRNGKKIEDFDLAVDDLVDVDYSTLTVVNAYTQFQPGRNVDYTAIVLVLKKLAYLFPDKRIALPLIGCGIAGGNWELVFKFIQQEMKDSDVTVVFFDEDVKKMLNYSEELEN